METEQNKTEAEKMAVQPVGSLLIQLAVPTVLAQLVNLLYNIVDRIYVGRIPGTGSLALAGLGVTFPIIMLISAFAALIGMGGAPRAAIAMGQKDMDGAEKTLGNCVSVLFLLSIALTAIFLIAKRPVLLMFGASADTLPFADSYITIYLCGTMFVQAALGLNMFITSQGFAKMGMATVCIGAVLNILLDPLFIYGFGLGVQGAALATIISQGVSAIWVLKFLTGKRTILKIRRRFLRPEAKTLLPVLALGLSPFIMQATECLIQLTFNSGMQKYGNDLYVALMAILFSIMQFVWLPVQGLAQGAQPIISYNYGAGNMERVKKTFRLTFIASVAYTVLLIAFIELAPGFFIGLFTNEQTLIEMGRPCLRVFMAGMIIMGAQSACQQTFLALGQAKISMFLALLRKVILLWPLALLIPALTGTGVMGLLVAEPIADVLAVITTTTLFYIRSKTLMASGPKPETA